MLFVSVSRVLTFEEKKLKFGGMNSEEEKRWRKVSQTNKAFEHSG